MKFGANGRASEREKLGACPTRIECTLGRLRERAKRDESDSGDGSGNVSGAGLDPTGSGHSSRRVQGL